MSGGPNRREVLAGGAALAAGLAARPALAGPRAPAAAPPSVVAVHPRMAPGAVHILRRAGRVVFVAAPGQGLSYPLHGEPAADPDRDRFVTLTARDGIIALSDRQSGAPTGLALSPTGPLALSAADLADLAARLAPGAPGILYRP